VLADLLWDERTQSQALGNLRRELTALRKSVGEYLTITRQSVELNPDANVWLDVRELEGTLTAVRERGGVRRMDQALAELYRGEFLEGFYIHDCRSFEEWLVRERERLHRLVVDGLHDLVTIELECGEFKSGIAHATRLLELDPLMEAAHRQMMNLLAVSGQRGAALAQYETCTELLEKELGAEPSLETQETYELLLKGDRPPGIPAVPAAHEVEIRRVGECPYRGLAAFREEDAAYFYGREGFTDMLQQSIHKWPLVAVIVGSSGSGKSSAVYAGLLPKLREDGGWLVSDFRPGAAPIRAISNALLPLLEPDIKETDRLIQAFKLEQALGEGELTISDVICQVIEREQQDKRVLLVVDQFEELYTLCPDPQLQQRFMDELLSAVETAGQRRDGCFVALLTMRADFMGQALTYRPFADALQDGSLLMGPMNREEMRAAIEKPAEMQGVGFESGLVERILDDVGGEPGNLPLLEFALTLLWEKENFGWLTHVAYEEIGRVEGALASYADQVYEGLKPGEGERARHVFVQLVRPGKGTEDTRRVARRDELGDENWELVQHLADKRLVVTGRDEGGKETAEVVHEALIQRWGLLREWMEADRDFRSWQERLRSNMRQWEESGRDEGVLLRGAPLAAAEEWLFERVDDLSPGEVEYIQASQERQERRIAVRENRRKRTILALAGGLVLALILALVAFMGFRRAQLAEKETFSRELAAQAINNLDVDPDRSILLALHALEVYDTIDAKNALRRSVFQHHLLDTLEGHSDMIMAMSLSPDGKTLVSGGYEERTILWDAESGEQLQILPQRSVTLAFSPDNRLLASLGFDTTIRIWQIPSDRNGQAQELFSFDSGHAGIVPTLAFSPDGTWLASGSNDTTVKIWDLKATLESKSGQLLHTLEGHNKTISAKYNNLQGVTDLIFTPDSRHLISCGTDGKIITWDLTAYPEAHHVTAHSASILAIALSLDGTHLATFGEDKQVKIWDYSLNLQPGDLLTIKEHAVGRALAFSPDGKLLAAGGNDMSIKVWELGADEVFLHLTGHSGIVQQVAFSQGSLRLFSGSEDATIKIWDMHRDHEVAVLYPTGNPSYSPDGKILTLASIDGIYLLDTENFEPLSVLSSHDEKVGPVSFSSDGRRLSLYSDDGYVRVWDVENERELAELTSPFSEQWLRFTAFSPDNRWLATSSKDGRVLLFDTTNWEHVKTFGIAESIDANYENFSWFDFHPDGNSLVIGDMKGLLSLWDLKSDSDQPLSVLNIGKTISYVYYDADGKYLAVSIQDGRRQVYELTEDEPRLKLSLTSSGPWRMKFNPDGSQLAVLYPEGYIKIVDALTGEESMRLFTNVGPVYNISFSPDGRYLASLSGGGTHVFTLQLDELITLARDRLWRKSLTDDECRQFLHMENCPEGGGPQE
jgi:WD40 repeat protein/DNA-binding SARP family transcriptional activator